MDARARAIPFRVFSLKVAAVHTALASTSMALTAISQVNQASIVLLLIVLFFLVGAPLAAVVGWLIGSGSKWENGLLATKIACVSTSPAYGFIPGALLGVRFLGTAGGLVGGFTFLVIGIIASYVLALMQWRRLETTY